MIKRLQVQILVGAAGEFSSPELTFGVHSTPVLPQWHPGHSAKSAGGRLHLNMHTSLTQWNHSGLTMPLCRHSVRTYQEISSHSTRQETLRQPSQLAELLWTAPGLKSGISVRDLISNFKEKSTGREWIVEYSPKILACEKKCHHHKAIWHWKRFTTRTTVWDLPRLVLSRLT